MRSDGSRFRFDPGRRFRRLRDEQGRVESDADENLYGPLRRLFAFIEASINAGLQWAGFEPPERRRWQKWLRRLW
jgi:hypothetical protein